MASLGVGATSEVVSAMLSPQHAHQHRMVAQGGEGDAGLGLPAVRAQVPGRHGGSAAAGGVCHAAGRERRAPAGAAAPRQQGRRV